MSKSLVSNYIFNLLNTVTGLLFPLITFPYTARILLPNGIGQIQFYSSIIDYISLISALGIPLYAVREVARARDNSELRNKISLEILILHTALSLLGYFVVLGLILFVNKLHQNIPLFLLLSLSIFFNTIAVNWFYQAIEEFKYITIRSLFIRSVSLISLFLFVHTKEDLLQYAAITVFSGAGASIFNIIRFRAFIKEYKVSWSQLKPLRHLKPALKIFTLNLIISIYVNLDSVMLGFLKNDQAVGYYAAAVRLTKVQLGIIGSLGAILLPRFSNLIALGKKEEFMSLANNAINYIFAIAFPLSIASILLAPQIIAILCGDNYNESIIVMQIISPIIFFIGLSSLIGMQILYPVGKESYVIKATALGAFLNFSVNYFLIPKIAQCGAAFATLLAEVVVTTVMIIIARKSLPFKFISRQNISYVLSSLIMGVGVFFVSNLNLSNILIICLSVIIGSILYIYSLFLFRDPFLLKGINLITIKLKK